MMSKQILNYLKKLAPVVFFFVIGLVIHLISFKFQTGYIINGGDIDYPLNSSLELFRSFHLWTGEALGAPEFFAISKLFLLLPKLFFELFISQDWLVNIFYFSFFRSLPGIGMYYLLKDFKWNRLTIWVGSLFFMLNTYIYLRSQFPQPHLILAYAIAPFLVLLIKKLFEGKLNPYYASGIFAFMMVSISRTANIYLLHWILTPLISILLVLSGQIEYKIKNTSFVIFFALSLFLNLVIFSGFIGSGLNYLDINKNSTLTEYRDDSIKISSDYKLVDGYSGFGSYAWTNNLSEVKAGDHNFPILSNFSKTTLLILSFIPIIIALIFGSFSLRKGWILGLLTIGLGILINGYGVQTASIYSFLSTSIPLFKDFFRDSWTYWSMPYFFLVSILLAASFKDLVLKKFTDFFNAKFLTLLPVLISIFVLVFIFYIFPGKAINPAWITKMPYGYLEMADYLEKNLQGEKVLALPITEHVYGYTYYNWKYAGPDPIHKLANVNYIDKYYNQILSKNQVDKLEELVEPNPEKLNDFLYSTQTNYILFRKDFLSLPDYSNAKVLEYQNILNNFDCWKIVSEFGDLALYKNICGDNSIRKEVQVSSKIIYGGLKCNYGINVDKYLKGTAVCGMEPKENNISLHNSVIEFKNIDKSYSYNLSSYESSLISNNNFSKGLWNNGERYTCDPDDPIANDFTINKINNGIQLQGGQKICIFEPIKNNIIKTGGLLKVQYSGNANSPIRYCIFSIKDNFCLEKGTFGIIDESLNTFSSTSSSTGTRTDYVYLKNVSDYKYKDNLFLYLYFNDSKDSQYSQIVNQVEFVTLPEGIDKEVSNSNENGKYLDLKTSENLVFKKVEVLNNPSGNYVLSYNTNSNNQWKLIGLNKKNEIVDFSENKLVTYGYANGWYIENIEKYSNFYIIYIPQLIFVIGLTLTIWIYFVYIVIYIKGKFQKKSLV